MGKQGGRWPDEGMGSLQNVQGEGMNSWVMGVVLIVLLVGVGVVG